MKKYPITEEKHNLEKEKNSTFQIPETNKQQTIKLLRENKIPFTVLYTQE